MLSGVYVKSGCISFISSHSIHSFSLLSLLYNPRQSANELHCRVLAISTQVQSESQQTGRKRERKAAANVKWRAKKKRNWNETKAEKEKIRNEFSDSTE